MQVWENENMIEMRGPSNSYICFEDEQLGNSQASPSYFCEAHTLGEALEKYCKEFGATVRPHATNPSVPPFAEAWVYDDPRSRFRDVIVRVSIERDRKWIAGSYGFDYPLLAGDKVSFVPAGC